MRIPIAPKFVKRKISRQIDRIERSNFLNESDKEVVFALERIFILDPPKTDDPEDEADFHLVRLMFATLAVMTFAQLGNKISGLNVDEFGDMFGIIATMSFTCLFVMIHHETKQTSVILLALTWFAGMFSLWLS